MMLTQSGEEEFLIRLTEITDANLSNERFGVSELARILGMSRSNLHRKVKSIAGTSISQFICKTRLKGAMELLKHSSSTISEIAFESGFQSVTYFIKCFHDHYGYSPGKVRMNEIERNNSDDLQRHNARMGPRKIQVSLAYLISAIFVLMAAIVLLFIFKPFATRDQSLDKSIAVLPFINDSPEESEMYFINGTMEAILNNLGKIKDLRVVSRTSVEQYRDNPKPISEIAEEMNVNYIIEGSALKNGNNLRLTIQLIDAIKDQQVWSKSFHRSVNEIFDLQSEIAMLVASEIEASITPEELELIEKIPTSSIVAYEFYQKGDQEEWIYRLDSSNKVALQKSEDLYRYALEYDSTFAKAYVGIAWIYWYKHLRDINHSGKYLDSVQRSLETALSYDDQLASAFNLRGFYYIQIGERERATEDFKKTLELSPSFRGAYHVLGYNEWVNNNFVGAIENFHKAALIKRGQDLPISLRNLGSAYFMAGFKDQSNYYNKLVVDLDGDSATYYHALAISEYLISNNIPKAIVLLKRGYAIDTSNTEILKVLGAIYLDIDQYAESLRYCEKYIDRLNALGQNNPYGTHWIGLSYWMNGKREKAEYYFDQQIKYCEEFINDGKNLHSQLSMVYAFRGEREKAYEHIRKFNKQEGMSVYNKSMKDNPFYESIWNEPEFQLITREIEAKYQAEHERVSQWLEENDMY